MKFINPSFLWALLLLAIPIIIHLFSFRRYKTVLFTNVRFLKEIKEETSSRSKLKHYLVLASRLLALAFLILAFAQPFIPEKEGENQSKRNTVHAIYIDNSFSMRAVNREQSLINMGKNLATELISNLREDDKIIILDNDLKAKNQRLIGKEEALGFVEEIDISPGSRKFNEITKVQLDIANRNGFNTISSYIISDFQRSVVSLDDDTTIQYFLIPLESIEENNVYIDTCYLMSPVQLMNDVNGLIVEVANKGNTEVEELPLTLKINDQTKAISNLKIAANSTRKDTLNFTITKSGWNALNLSINDYPVTFDDQFYAAFYVPEKLKVMTITEGSGNKFLKAIYSNEEVFEFFTTSSSTINYSEFSNYDLIILDNLNTPSSGLAKELKDYLSNEGNLVIFPGPKASSEYNNFLSILALDNLGELKNEDQTVRSIDRRQQVFQGVFDKIPQNILLPTVKKYYSLSKRGFSNSEDILTLKNGDPLLKRFKISQGFVYQFSTPLLSSYTDLAGHGLFLPIMYKMAISKAVRSNLSYTIGQNNAIRIKDQVVGNDEIFKLKGKTVEFIPQQSVLGNDLLIKLDEQVKEAGVYSVTKSVKNAALLGINYNRSESELSYYSIEELESVFSENNISIIQSADKSASAIVEDLDKGKILWKTCIILALIFLTLEVLLLKFWKS